MVWHAHMLNPRSYAEDCMRRGLRRMWRAGIPWHLINSAIDTKFSYRAPSGCPTNWANRTKRAWDNTEESLSKTLPPCPKCGRQNVVPWTTCGMAEDSPSDPPELIGHGYGDDDFKTACTNCGTELTKAYLEVIKFGNDVKNLLVSNHPMPGTILDNQTGRAQKLPEPGIARDRFQRTFPNRLIRNYLRSQVLQPPPASMDAIRILIENAINSDDEIKIVEGVTGRDLKKRYRLGMEARIHVRKMMSRYWGNSSPFALELGGAVLRQAIFTEKMYKVCLLVTLHIYTYVTYLPACQPATII